MKNKLLLFLMIFTTMIFGCEKSEFDNIATITGADMTLCACCGGYFIEIDAIQYRFEKSELPSGFTFDDKQLPLEVELNWKLKTDQCVGSKWITISRIKKK